MSNEALEKFCEAVVDTLYSDLGKREFFIRTLQGKNGNIYLRIKKKKEELSTTTILIFLNKKY